jgi:ribosomal-protein-alanine N-acetyltransferase
LNDLPSLTTERLVLRVPTPDDAEAMCRYVNENRNHLSPWDPARSDEYFTVDYWRHELDRVVDEVREGTRLQFMLLSRKNSGGPIQGQCTYSNIVRGPFQAAYLGYALARRVEGQGLMEEALRATIDYCFRVLNLHRIMANYTPGNARSARLLKKLGFAPEGYARDYLRIAGEWQDHVLTTLINDDWISPGREGVS